MNRSDSCALTSQHTTKTASNDKTVSLPRREANIRNAAAPPNRYIRLFVISSTFILLIIVVQQQVDEISARKVHYHVIKTLRQCFFQCRTVKTGVLQFV